MGDANQRHGAFLQALAVEICNAELRDDVVHFAAGRRDPGSAAKLRYDLGNSVVIASSLKGDNRPAARRSGRTVSEVHVASHPGKASFGRTCCNLPGQVHLDRDADRNHIIVLTYKMWVADILGRAECKSRIAVDEVVKPPRTHT